MLFGGYIDILKLKTIDVVSTLLDICPNLKEYNIHLTQSNDDYFKHTIELIKSNIKYEDFLQILYLINPLKYMSKIYKENFKIYSDKGYLIYENKITLNDTTAINYIFHKENFTINPYNNEELHIESIKYLTDIYTQIILNNKIYIMSQGIFYSDNINFISSILIKTADYYPDNLNHQFIKILLNMLFIYDGVNYIDIQYFNVINQLMFTYNLKSVLDININYHIEKQYMYDNNIFNFFSIITNKDTTNKLKLFEKNQNIESLFETIYSIINTMDLISNELHKNIRKLKILEKYYLMNVIKFGQ
jgi:hypothetical protein